MLTPASRRSLLAMLAAGPALPLAGTAGAQPLAPTPECGDHAAPTAAQTEGPFFKPAAPLKRDLAADAPNAPRIALVGFVLDRGCRPLAGSLVQIWQADETGAYDTKGYRLRGHQFADESGRWSFATIVPGGYPGRTRHFHVKVQPPGGRILTTQLYFPGEPLNRRDGLFDERLLLRLSDGEDGRLGRFDFVV